MELLARAVASGRIAEIALLALILEGAAMIGFSRRRALDVVLALLPGALLLLALRAALMGQSWTMVVLWLTLSLPAHLADMRRRR
jgi:hypothetical protein